jgi:glucosyl-3-phosphoglycerate phosphatase
VTLRRLVLWRHGETEFNAGRRMQGQLDSLLTPLGIDQARRAAPVLAALGPQVLLTSDLRRAADTAAALAEYAGLEPLPDTRLRETHLGQWQGLTHDEVDAVWPAARLTWRTDPAWTPPGGESRVEVAARALAVVAELDAADADTQTAVLCAHGGLIAALSASLLDLPVAYWCSFGGIGNCRWTILERPANLPWRLMTYNAGLLEFP